MILDSLPAELQPHEATFFRIVREGLALFHRRYGTSRAMMSRRSERSNIHDCMVEIARQLLPEKNWRQRGNLFLICIGAYRIKLKKFDKALSTSSYPTQAVFDFLQQKFRDLFDEEPLTNLHLGYVLDGLTVHSYPVFVTRPKGFGRPQWEYELREALAGALPALPVTSPAVPPATRVRPKTTKRRKTGSAE